LNRNNYFRSLLKAKKITTLELSKKMCIAQQTLNKKIKGDVKFSENDIKFLTEFLNLTYEQLFSNNYKIVTIDSKSFVVAQTTASQLEQFIISNNEKEVS